jgi:HAE1 family hydrophobic/amphiphilic exporter-1
LESRRPLGVASGGGLCVWQLLTLYITPVVHYYLDKIDSALAGRRQTAPKAAAAKSEKLAAAAE